MKDLLSLVSYDKNNKKHPEEQVSLLMQNISKFGFTTPFLISGDNTIIAGHGRKLACDKLGIKKVPCIIIDDLSEEEIKALRIADNRLGELGETDWMNLQEEFLSLKETGLDFLTGYTEEDFNFIEDNKEVEEDDFEPPEDIEEIKTDIKLGDVIQLGNHRLMCGDSTKKEDVDKLMNGNKADMVFTDPPYGMFLNADYSSMINNLDFAKEKNFKGGKKYNNVIGDHSDFNEDFINIIFNKFNYCKEIFLWGADYYTQLLINRNDGSWLVWDKRANKNNDIDEDNSSDKMYGSCFELCWSKSKHKRDIVRIKWAGVFGTEKEFDHKRHHPTQKPILLSSWFLNKYSKNKNNVIDLFGGSGSTLIACEQLDRVCYMMELDEKYCEVICQRWEKLTNKKREVLNG